MDIVNGTLHANNNPLSIGYCCLCVFNIGVSTQFVNHEEPFRHEYFSIWNFQKMSLSLRLGLDFGFVQDMHHGHLIRIDTAPAGQPVQLGHGWRSGL